MNTKEAINKLNKENWSKTSVKERLRLLEELRENIIEYADDLAVSEAKMKNNLMNEKLYSLNASMLTTAVPIATTVSACIDLYKSLNKGVMPKAISINKVDDDLFDVQVFPSSVKDKIMYGDTEFYIRVKGDPKQINPMNKEVGITAVLGAGNYSSSLEMVKAMFLDNNVVVHKPHQLNQETDAIWEKIFKPLVDIGAISFCSSEFGKELTQDERLDKIYFTGGSGTAQAIMQSTKTPLISECGGNNPCIIVPGIRDWTEKEVEHQAIQTAPPFIFAMVAI